MHGQSSHVGKKKWRELKSGNVWEKEENKGIDIGKVLQCHIFFFVQCQLPLGKKRKKKKDHEQSYMATIVPQLAGTNSTTANCRSIDFVEFISYYKWHL